MAAGYNNNLLSNTDLDTEVLNLFLITNCVVKPTAWSMAQSNNNIIKLFQELNQLKKGRDELVWMFLFTFNILKLMLIRSPFYDWPLIT